MSLYKLLYDLPEPTVALAAAISDRQKAIDAEAELKTVKDTLSEYDKEFGKLKNQDVTVRRLEDENKQLMAKMETRVQSVCDEVRRQLTEDFEQRNARAREREHELMMQSQVCYRVYV
jgi:predicted  nucleic acid-binding Zn-ribbon protein